MSRMRGRTVGQDPPAAGPFQQETTVQFLDTVVNGLNGLVWGPPMLVLILGTGLFLMLRLGFMPLTKIAAGFRLAWRSRARRSEESRVGKECDSPCRSRWSPDH